MANTLRKRTLYLIYSLAAFLLLATAVGQWSTTTVPSYGPLTKHQWAEAIKQGKANCNSASSTFKLFLLLLLQLQAEKARQAVGEDGSSQSGKFTWLNCFDMGTGSLACISKEAIKSYVYNIRAGHIARARQRSFEIAYTNALSEGKSIEAASKEATRVGDKAEKLASRQARRILGPISAACWDGFEALYYGGTLFEAAIRGAGTIGGTYIGGFQGESSFGRMGYLLGSHIGSWVGGRIGLMLYDISVGVHFVISQFLVEDTGPTEIEYSSDL